MDRSKAPGTSEKSPPPGSTTEEDKMQKLKEKLDGHFYNKESNHSKETTSKRLPDYAIPSTSSNQASISKEDKKIILEREAKLKKIVEDEELLADNNGSVRRDFAKPRVKISQENRGDFLCNEQEAPVSKRSASRSAERAKSSNDKANRTTSTCDANVPRSITHGIETNKLDEIISKNAVNNVATLLEQSLCINNILDSIKLLKKYNTKKSNTINNTQEGQSSSKIRRMDTENTINAGEMAVSKSLEGSSECASVSKEKSSLSSNLAETKNNEKTINFSTNVDIMEYEIESENTLKKLIGKDAPIPTDKLIKVEETADATQWNSTYEEFLYRIFMWKPVWLEEQRYFGSDPPMLEEELQPMKVHYTSFRCYYKVATPLLLLETWHSICRDFETIEENAQRMTVMCSIVANTIRSKPIPTTDLFLTDMMLEVLVTKEEDVRSYPRVGDLVSIEYASHANDKQTFLKVFAYINNLYQTTITDFTRYNLQLRQYINNPTILITYTILTGPIQHNIHLNRVHRMRTIKCLRPKMKMVQAIQRLPQSPLVHLILNPKIQDYKLPPLNESFTCDSLVTKDRLNQKQLEAVSRVTDAVFKNEAKIALIQGPPGTGKTKVIVNLVTQILYGEYNERAEKNKILLCAPSDAAIDEIVTRLLVIRSQPEKRNTDRDTFNLVRIGVPEYMHPAAKTVSLSNLARRNLKRFTESVFSSNSTTDLRMEKIKLLRQIEEFERQRGDPNLTEMKRSGLKRNLTYATCKLELLQIDRLFDKLDPKERNKYQRRVEDKILANADIIACTLSSCHTNQMESIFGINKKRFSVCIVDEATQGREVDTLIPLMLGVNTLVLVGDPNQLPATVLSQRAKKLGWDQSMFSRMQYAFESETNTPIIMLDTQYRMAHSISYWPNKYFYDSKLKNSAENKQTFPVHPYRVLSHNSMQNSDKFSNTTEAEFVSNIIYTMLKYAKWESTNEPISVGVLTPYNHQRSIVLQKIHEKISNLPNNMKKKITYEVNTVDSFRGQERDIIIMSCVRSHGIGFLSDKQRLCVALTRARHSLILCGNFNHFMEDSMWNSLLFDAKNRGVLCYVDADATSAIIKPYVVK